MKEFGFYTCDVFTDRCFSGNQLAVIPDAERFTAKEMQRIAAEFNFSETTFVMPSKDPNCSHRVRIFTPKHELPFAGHPVLGTAFILAGRGTLKSENDTIKTVFELEIGPVPVEIQFAEGEPAYMRLTIPEP
ncbi:MAG: PhzF family phenazine biosynthesis isomerase, partial [Spirochaetia bacterium]|nr:PhzF family phenazine biosynthesis isomerase [Spirochaetia bacterium]